MPCRWPLVKVLICIFSITAFSQTVPVSTIVECEDHSESFGMNPCNDSTRCPGWGSDINLCNNNDWVRYNGINFMDGEFSYIDIYGMDVRGDNNTIEIRIDSRTGPLIGSIRGVQTLQSGIWGKYTAQLMITSGTHDVFLIFKSSSPNAADTSIIGSFDRFELRGLTKINPADAKEYYVSTLGNDGNDGSLGKPFRTIAKASSLMKPGSTCYIRQGIYRETIRPAYTGLAGAALTYTNYNNENVFISACDEIQGWSLHSGKIYTASMPWSLGDFDDQLFLDGEMVWAASSPNVDDACFNAKYWETLPCNVGKQGRVFPLLIPQEVDFAPTTSFTPEKLPDIIGLRPNSPELPASMLNKPRDFFKGALWVSRLLQGFVLDNEPFGSTVVTGSEPNLRIAPLRTQWWQQAVAGFGRFTHALNLLDAPREWFRKDGVLYLMAPDGQDPTHHLVEAKKRILCADLRGKSYVNLIGLKTIGGSMTLENAFYCKIDRCEAKYIAHKDTLTALEGGAAFWEMVYDPTTGSKGIYISGIGNIIKNSLIAISSASGIVLDGRSNTVDNCIIRDCDYTSCYDAGIYIDKARTWDNNVACDLAITHNTLYNFGRSALHVAYTGNTSAYPITIKYNDFGASMFRSCEGGTIYVYGGQANFTEVAYNWFHDVTDCQTAVIYLDDASRNWIFHHNVFWHGELWNPTQWFHSDFKPNDGTTNMAWNNTHVDSCLKRDFCGIELAGYNDLWANSDTTFWKFNDPADKDFSLRAGSPAIDKGQLIPDITQRYKGSAPDLGAYEYGETPWKAGADWQEKPWVYPPPLQAAIKDFSSMRPAEHASRIRTMPGRLRIEIPGAKNGRLTVHNARGACVVSIDCSGKKIIELPTAQFAAGIYYVKLYEGKYSTVWKTLIP